MANSEKNPTEEIKNLADQDHHWSTYFIRNQKVGVLVGIVLIIFGGLGTYLIPKESSPSINFGMAIISTVYPGAGAEDIDTLITQKIEGKLRVINGIKKLSSTSQNGISTISIEFEPEVDMVKAMNDLRSKVSESKSDLPSDLESDPYVLEVDTSMVQPFFSIVVYGPYADYELTDFAEELKTYLESIADVASVNIMGGADREIVIDIDPAKLEAYGTSMDEVIFAIQSSHRDTPVGDFEIETFSYNIRFEGKYETPGDIANINLKNLSQNGKVSMLTIGDVASITEKGEDTNSIMRMGFPGKETENAVELSVSKKKNANIFSVDANVRKKMDEYAITNFPDDLKYTYTMEAVIDVKESYVNTFDTGWQAILIVLLLLFAFIGLREGFVAALVIPMTVLTTIGFYHFVLGETLNFIVNFSMIIALGILVDTSIVIVQAIRIYIDKGLDPKDAAIATLREFNGPLISSVLTNIVVFIPLFSLPGLVGKFLSYIPVTLFIVQISALLISLLIIPAIASVVMKPKKKEKPCSETKSGVFKHVCTLLKGLLALFRTPFRATERFLVNSYEFTLKKLLPKRFFRLGIFWLVSLSFALSFLLPVKFILFPTGDLFYFTIQVEKSKGMTAETIEALLPAIEEKVFAFPEVKKVQTTVSGDQANLYVELYDAKEREAKGQRTSVDVTNELKRDLEPYALDTGATIRIANAENGPPSEFPVGYRVVMSSPKLIPEAEEVAKDLTEILKDIPGTSGVKHDIELTAGEFLFRVDREKAINLHLNPDTIAFFLRKAVKGINIGTISRGDRDMNIIVKYDEKTLEHIDDLLNISLQNQMGEYIPLSEVVDENLQSSLSTVRRRDTKLAFTVSSLLDENGNAAEISAEFLKRIDGYNLPDGVTIEDAGENAANVELIKAFQTFFVIAIFLIFFILVIEFDSFSQPLLILLTILFAQIGVNFGLWVTNSVKGLPYLIGLITLSGIVVNNSIILIDQINKRHQELPNESIFPLIAESGKSRFMPILLTTLSTTFGIVPLIFIDVFWSCISYTIIFGLLVGTVLTLFVTPISYYQLKYEKVLTFLPIIALAPLSQVFMNTNMMIQGISGVITIVLFLFVIKAYRKARKMDLEKSPVEILD